MMEKSDLKLLDVSSFNPPFEFGEAYVVYFKPPRQLSGLATKYVTHTLSALNHKIEHHIIKE